MIINVVYILIYAIYLQKKIIELLKKLRNFVKFGYPRSILKINKNINLMTTLSFYYVIVGMTVVQIEAFTTVSSCEKNLYKTGRGAQCEFIIRLKYPYSINNSPWYELHMFFIYFALIIFCGECILVFNYIYTAVKFLTARLEHLHELIENLSQESNRNDRQMRLRICIMYHIDIIG